MFWDSVVDFIITNYLTLSISIGLLILPSTKFSKKDKQDIVIKLTVAFTVLIAVFDKVELYFASLSYPTFWRVLFSVFNYILRPGVIMLLGIAIAPSFMKKVWVYIPIGVDIAIFSTAFFSGIAFSYNVGNGFIRGPLGYVSAIVSVIYLALNLFMILYEHRGKMLDELLPLLFIAAAGAVAGFLELAGEGQNILNGSIIIGCLFYHIFVFRMRSKTDLLTELYNRQQLYSDIEKSRKSIKAVISIDMNGLKKLNDSKGHSAGDNALAKIGEIIRSNVSFYERGYRIGGDEFVVISKNPDASSVVSFINKVEGDLFDNGISCSFGFVNVSETDRIEDSLQNADQMMYREKQEYYETSQSKIEN